MSRLPIPHLVVDSIYDVSPDMLSEMGIGLLMLDLDNTLVPGHIREITPKLRGWINSLKSKNIEPFILSNNRGKKPGKFARELEIGYINNAGKPSRRMLHRVMAEKNSPPEQTAIVGDQIYTDVFCGIRAGITTIAVKPISLYNPIYALRYLLEIPFRLIYKVRNKNERFAQNTKQAESL